MLLDNRNDIAHAPSAGRTDATAPAGPDAPATRDSKNRSAISKLMAMDAAAREALLSSDSPDARLSALFAIAAAGVSRDAEPREEYVNNHIHTIYSFSPYSPAMAAYKAWRSGLMTAGIMDHDSVAGAEEFAEAGRMLGLATTTGMECRCSFAATPFAGRRINNTDQDSIAYIALHGIPRTGLAAAEAFIAPYRAKRLERSRRMTKRASELLSPAGVTLDFDEDVMPLSQASCGGGLTERHIMCAMARKAIMRAGRGKPLLEWISQNLGIAVPSPLSAKLEDASDPDYEYRLLGLFKSEYLPQVYIDAGDELPDVHDLLGVARRTGAIAAYPYLGDVRGSVTGDKKDDAFEDSYLDELMQWLAEAGFAAITYMPARNTEEQLARLISLCKRYGMFEISGEDINTPFQPFICSQIAKPMYRHLVESTWALVGHEIAATQDISEGMFTQKTLIKRPQLEERVKYYAEIGRSSICPD